MPNTTTPTALFVETTTTPTPYFEPTYVVYARAVDATAQAIVVTLPTPSPFPNLRPDLQEQAKWEYLWHIALPTAIALVPTLPPDYDPRSEFTPSPVRSPFPTEMPYPSTPTANGNIYNRSLEDSYQGKWLAEVNYWLGEIGGLHTHVFAGHVNGEPSQGTIVIQTPITGTVGVNDPNVRVDRYRTPTQSGAVRIIDEVRGRFTLQAADGSFFYFDLNTRQWVLLTPQPSPSITATPTPAVLSPVVTP